jgi:hypothetical protein
MISGIPGITQKQDFFARKNHCPGFRKGDTMDRIEIATTHFIVGQVCGEGTSPRTPVRKTQIIARGFFYFSP